MEFCSDCLCLDDGYEPFVPDLSWQNNTEIIEAIEALSDMTDEESK